MRNPREVPRSIDSSIKEPFMNATSLIRPCLWLLAAPVLVLGLCAALPTDAPAAPPASRPAPASPQAQAAGKQTPNSNFSKDKHKNKKHAGKAKKHHKKHKHHKHHKKHGKNAKNGKSRAGMDRQINQDIARVQRDEQALARDTTRLRKVLK
jgi:hypothetical protein